MLPRPSLIGLNGTSDGEFDGTQKDDTTHEHTRRKNAHKRQRGERVAPPLSPPAPMRLRRIQKVHPPRYQDIFDGHQAPFWERQQLEEEEERSPRRQSVASIRRQSQLFAFVVTIASFAAVDKYMLLPTGIIIYSVALSIAWENWEEEAQENLRYLETLRHHREQIERIEREVEKAEFEYHVLRNKPHVNIMAVRKTKRATGNIHGLDFDPEHDEWIVYADEKRRHLPPPEHYWRSNFDRTN